MNATVAPPDVDDIYRYCRTGFEFASDLDWRSLDPFDFLLAPFGERTRRLSPFAARLLIQLGRRSGRGLRRLAQIRPREEAKAIADFLWASVVLAAAGQASWVSSYHEALSSRLERLSIELPNGRGWGYQFPYASRFVSVPAHTPNAYATVCCVTALTSAASYLQDDYLLDIASSGARSVSVDLGIVRDGEQSWFRYYPGDDSWVVNVQALIAGCFQELGQLANNDKLCTYAELAATAAIVAQQNDGSFPYAMDKRGQFVDAFHTGFVLEGLNRFRRCGGKVDLVDVDASVANGMDFMRQHLIGLAHLPRRFPDGPVALDGQNVAQLIQTLVLCGDAADRTVALRCWSEWIRQAGPPIDSQYRRGRTSLRWDVSPMVLASSHLAANLEGAR